MLQSDRLESGSGPQEGYRLGMDLRNRSQGHGKKGSIGRAFAERSAVAGKLKARFEAVVCLCWRVCSEVTVARVCMIGFVLLVGLSIYLGMHIYSVVLAAPTDARSLKQFLESPEKIEVYQKLVSLSLRQVKDRVSFVGNDGFVHPVIFDVTSDGEFSFLQKFLVREQIRIPREEQWVVDIGAYDGVWGSNSYNLVELGWNALLAEPFKEHYLKAVRNTKRFNQLGQRVNVANVGIGDYDGPGYVCVGGDNVQMENRIYKSKEQAKSRCLSSKGGGLDKIFRTEIRTASTLLAQHNVPHNFALLSIDAEGKGQEVLESVFESGTYHPRFIIIEFLHATFDQAKYMRSKGYVKIGRVGYNDFWTLQSWWERMRDTNLAGRD